MSTSKRRLFRRLSLVLIALLLVISYIALPLGEISGRAVPHKHHGLFSTAAAVAAEPAPLSRVGWTAQASDEETLGENGGASNILDGEANTHWHSRWTEPTALLPHSITIDTKTTQKITGLRYLPRADNANGRVGNFEILVSTNGSKWSKSVSRGTWADSSEEKSVKFAAVSARFVRLMAISEAGNRGPWSSAAEINLVGEQSTPLPPTSIVLSRSGWVASASDEEVGGENGRAINVLDGDATTIWHSRWTPDPPAPLPHTLSIDMGGTNKVSGLRYLPRADQLNGRIGAYSISVSLNAIDWTPVTNGVWADTGDEKTVVFPAVSSRYVQLTASTEAGNRGPFSSAAEINILGDQPAKSALGIWGSTINFPIVPAAAALLPGNKLLTWSAYSPTTFGGSKGITQTSVFDLSTGTVSHTQVSQTGHDMFCPGTSLLADGRILVSGGSDSGKTSFYNPRTDTWSPGPDMQIPRAYQSNVTMSSGEVFSIGGSWSGALGGKHGEVWSDAGGWRTLPGVSVSNILTNDPAGEFRSDNHAWLSSAAGGRVFHAGPSRQMNWISSAGSGSITPAGQRSDSPDAMNGNAVMYDIGKILTMGGASAYENVAATARAYAIDINEGVTVSRTADMGHTRSFANGVALPDGQVLVVGGQATPVPFSDSGARMEPELWNPATGKWTMLAPMTVPRTYHSVALLLPDGRVFVGGGGLCDTCTTNHLDGQIFTPPYLLNTDGTERPRPSILSAPVTAAAGSKIAVTTGSKISKFSLMRMSTVTHTVNTDQRRIPLTAINTSGNTATLSLPGDRGVLVPGSYLLFAMDSNGVPSVATTLTIT